MSDVVITAKFFEDNLMYVGVKPVPKDLLKLTKNYFEMKRKHSIRMKKRGRKSISNSKSLLTTIQRYFSRLHNPCRTPKERNIGRKGLLLTHKYSYLYGSD